MNTKKLRIVEELKELNTSIECKNSEINVKKTREQEVIKKINILRNKKYLNNSFGGHKKNNIIQSRKKHISNLKKLNKLNIELGNIPNTIEEIEEQIKKIKGKGKELLIVLEAEAKEWNFAEALLDFEKRNILFTIKAIKNEDYNNRVVEIDTEDANYLPDMEDRINMIKNNIFNYESEINDINFTIENIEEINKKNIDYNNNQYSIFNPRIENAATKQEAKGWRKQLYNNLKDIFTEEELITTLENKKYYLKSNKKELVEIEKTFLSETNKIEKRKFTYIDIVENIEFYVRTMYIIK